MVRISDNLELSIINNSPTFIFSSQLIVVDLKNLPSWKRYCYSINTEKFTSRFKIDDDVFHEEEISPLTAFPEVLKFRLYSHEYFKITLINVYTGDIPSFTACPNFGDLYAWNISDWTDETKRMCHRDEEVDEICRKKIKFEYPVELDLQAASKKCDMFKGKIAQTHQTEYQLSKHFATKKYWQPYLYYQNKNLFVTFYGNFTSDVNFTFENGQPNGGGDQQGLICNSQVCMDSYVSTPRPFLCEIPNDLRVNVRGLCSKTSIDRHYLPTSAYNKFAMLGRSSTQIIINGTWQLNVTGSNTYANSGAAKMFALLGTHHWKVNNDEGCDGQSVSTELLNFNTCLENEFNCHNGDCINITKRCDGSTECPDASDEKNCVNLVTAVNYNSRIGDTNIDNDTTVNTTFYLLHFLNINDNKGYFMIQFAMKMEWIDSRLNFTNLKAKYTQLLNKERAQIWQPNLYFVDTNHHDKIVHIDEIAIEKDENYSNLYADSTFLHNELIFPGKTNKLIYYTEQRLSLKKNHSVPCRVSNS